MTITVRAARPASSFTAGGGTSITHGSQITAANTGHTAYQDPALGRLVTDADLTVHSSLVYLSDLVAAGGTLTRHKFAGGVNIDVAATCIACVFEGQVQAVAGSVFRYCTIDSSGTAGDYGIGYGGYTAERCRIGGGSDGVKAGSNGPTTLTECYIRTKGQSTADHNDGMQDSYGAYPVTVQRCNIDCRPVNALGNTNAALFGADSCTGPHAWYDNLLAGGAYVMRMYENAHYDVQGNWVVDGTWSYGISATAVIPISYIQFGTIRPNLLVDASSVKIATITTAYGDTGP